MVDSAISRSLNRCLYKSRTVYRSKLNPFATVTPSDILYSEKEINAEIKNNGLGFQEFLIDIADFYKWQRQNKKLYPESYQSGYGKYLQEKCLEHYLSLMFHDITPSTVIIDIANAGSPFPRIALATGATVYVNDLAYPEETIKLDENLYQIGGNACNLHLPDAFADLIVLHCAFEMFEGEQDGLLIQEAARVLKPGGKMVIIPLYLSSSHHILCDIGVSRMGCRYDKGAKIIYCPNFGGVRFACFYDIPSFKNGILSVASKLRVSILYCTNASVINPDRNLLYLRYIGLFEK